MVPKMEACLRAVEGGLTRATVDRRPGAARAAAGDLHQHRDRHHGHPGRAGPAGQPGVLRRPGIPPHEYANGEFGGSTSPSEPARMTEPRPRRDSRPADRPGSAPVLAGYERLGDEHLRPAQAGLRPRRGLPRLGRGRPALPRPALRSGGQRPRPRPPDRAVGDHRADRHPRPRLQLLRHPGPGRPGRPARARSTGGSGPARSSSPTPAPRPTRPRSRSPG